MYVVECETTMEEARGNPIDVELIRKILPTEGFPGQLAQQLLGWSGFDHQSTRSGGGGV